MAEQSIALEAPPTSAAPTQKKIAGGLTEDWWAVWLGLGIILLAYVFYLTGSSISWIAVAPAKWSTFSELGTQLSKNGVRYLALLAAFLVLFTIVTSFIGQKPRAFVPSFIFVFLLSTVIYIIFLAVTSAAGIVTLWLVLRHFRRTESRWASANSADLT